MKVDIDTSDKLYADAWLGFKGTDWKNEINVRDFIQHNGNDSNLLIVFYVQIMPDDFVMQLHRF